MNINFIKKNKIVFIVFGVFVLVGILILIITSSLKKNNDESLYNNYSPNNNSSIQTYTETINDINWNIKYDTNRSEVLSISAVYEENDKSSKYWKELTYKHGDSSLVVKHKIILYGTPMEDGWYKITKQEIYYYQNETFYDSTTRYEEKLPFTTLP